MFKSQVAAITGASSGIGRALAVELAGRGARLALADIDGVALAQTLQMLPPETEARPYLLDVASQDAVFGFAADVHRDFGAIHYIVNNAGTGVVATVEHLTIAEIERVLNINLWGVIFGTKAFLPIMLAQKEGCIVNISSVFGLLATPCNAAYVMSKFAVRGLTETLWQELDGTGVRAVVVHPGGINTNIAKHTPRSQNEGEFERKLMAGMLRQMSTSPKECAVQIITGLESGKKRLVVGNGARTIHRISRLFPDSYGGLLRRKLGS
jgi:NAD(P)-dependent dehydrogenase (short-subunit alcohol dehydrogenase family)